LGRVRQILAGVDWPGDGLALHEKLYGDSDQRRIIADAFIRAQPVSVAVLELAWSRFLRAKALIPLPDDFDIIHYCRRWDYETPDKILAALDRAIQTLVGPSTNLFNANQGPAVPLNDVNPPITPAMVAAAMAEMGPSRSPWPDGCTCETWQASSVVADPDHHVLCPNYRRGLPGE
jgi:hypothetical protein